MKKYKQIRKPYRVVKKKSIFRNRIFWQSVAFVFLAGGIFYLFVLAPFVQVSTAIVEGNQELSAEELAKEALEKTRQKIIFFESQSIFLINVKRIKNAVSEKFPQVARIDLKRKFPSSIVLKIEERVPAVIIRHYGGYAFVDKEGVAFEDMSMTTYDEISAGYLIINNIDSESQSITLGTEAVNKDLLSLILKIASTIKSDLDISIQHISIQSDAPLCVETTEGWKIYFDQAKDIGWQLTKLKAVLEEKIPPEKRKDLDYIDLRFGNLAPYKYRAD